MKEAGIGEDKEKKCGKFYPCDSILRNKLRFYGGWDPNLKKTVFMQIKGPYSWSYFLRPYYNEVAVYLGKFTDTEEAARKRVEVVFRKLRKNKRLRLEDVFAEQGWEKTNYRDLNEKDLLLQIEGIENFLLKKQPP
jgi:hypothetical protein